MQLPEQENQSGSREGKNRTRVVDNAREVDHIGDVTNMVKKPSGGRERHPGGWSAFCRSPGCSGYASFRCPDCKQPVCTGCAREWHEDEEPFDEKIICGNCYEAL